MTSLEIKNDSNLIITGGEDHIACVGNIFKILLHVLYLVDKIEYINTGKPVTKFVGHTDTVECVGFSRLPNNNFAYQHIIIVLLFF